MHSLTLCCLCKPLCIGVRTSALVPAVIPSHPSPCVAHCRLCVVGNSDPCKALRGPFRATWPQPSSTSQRFLFYVHAPPNPQTLHMSEIQWYLSLRDWLVSCNTVISSPVYFPENDTLFLWLSMWFLTWVAYCIYQFVYMEPSLHSWIEAFNVLLNLV